MKAFANLGHYAARELAKGAPEHYSGSDREVWAAWWQVTSAINVITTLPGVLISLAEVVFLALEYALPAKDSQCDAIVRLLYLASADFLLSLVQLVVCALSLRSCVGMRCQLIFQLFSSFASFVLAIATTCYASFAFFASPHTCWIAAISLAAGAGSLFDAATNSLVWPIALWVHAHQHECPLPNVRRFSNGAIENWLRITQAIDPRMELEAPAADEGELDPAAAELPCDAETDGERLLRPAGA